VVVETPCLYPEQIQGCDPSGLTCIFWVENTPEGAHNSTRLKRLWARRQHPFVVRPPVVGLVPKPRTITAEGRRRYIY
jgi:hypothetical protein